MQIRNISPAITVNKNNQNKNVAFSGWFNTTHNLAKDFFKLERKGNMARGLFITNAFAFLLGGRLLRSRDKNEVRETLTRDVPSIALAVFGVPFFGNIFAHYLQNKSGFAIVNKNEKNPIAEAMDYDQLRNLYIYEGDEKVAKGFIDGFSQRLADKGGKLKTIYSTLKKSLSEKAQTQLAEFSDDSKKFIEQLRKVENKNLLEELKNAFKSNANTAYEQAAHLRTLPKVFGFALTLVSIGLFIPKFNIYLTEKLNKKNKPSENSSTPKPAETKPSAETKKPFEEITK